MKALITMGIALLCLSAKAQDYSRHPDLLLNAKLVNPDKIEFDAIYKLQKIKNIDSKWNDNNNEITSFKKFQGDTLTVVYLKKYKEFSDRPSVDHIVLKSLKTGAMYEYEYRNGILPFKVASFENQVSDEMFYSDIETTTDKFTGTVSVSSPDNIVQFSKMKSGGRWSYFLYLKTGCPSPDGVGKRGVNLLLSDGSRMEFPNAEIDVKTTSAGGFMYSSIITLHDQDIEKLSKNKITAFRLYVAERDIPDFDSSEYRAYLKGIISNQGS